MKKKVFLFGISIIFLILVLPFLIADETEAINKAYECLEGKVNDTCSSLSSEERIFSLLATGECKDGVISDSDNNKCWPGSGCKIKTTVQALLALDKSHTSTTEAEAWLFSQNITTSEIIWYLEIESSEATDCTVTYSNSSYPIKINADKKIEIDGGGTCLSLSEGEWWLKISPSCYNIQEFKISCDKSFLTTLLYQKSLASTIYVSENTNSASAGGTTTEKVNSFCFKQGSSCDYEASLWAALVLNYLGHDMSSYLPYLVTMADETENIKYIPDAFLYSITTNENFRANLLNQQKSGGWWLESGDKFYDTALALLPFHYEESLQEKTDAKEWLLEAQDSDGCWQGNIRNTAFILYSVWPKELPSGGNGNGVEVDCEDAGYYCMSSMSCDGAGGEELEDYSCFGVNVCCDEPPVSKECVADLGGEICDSDEDCAGGNWEDASDLDYGQRCCVGGTCEEETGVSECEYYGGTCRTSCEDDEEETSDECDYPDEVCCEKKTISPESSYWWLWVLLSLIALIVLGIIFRDKTRHFWFKMKSKFKKSKPPKPGFPSLPPRTVRRIMPRNILPAREATRRPAPVRRQKSELDDVLKKLKEMGK